MKFPNNIWDTLEMDCVCRDLSYEDYLFFHKALQMQSAPLKQEAYSILEQLVITSMELDGFFIPK